MVLKNSAVLIISVIAAVTLALLTTGCGDSSTENTTVTTGLMKGQRAPDFTLQDLDGNSVTLASFQNKHPVCLVFWATWCPHCITDIPFLKKIHNKYHEKGLRILAVDIAANDPISRVKAFRKKYNIPYTILYDAQNSVSRLYSITGVPVSIIIDKSGIIRFRGYKLPESIPSLLDELV